MYVIKVAASSEVGGVAGSIAHVMRKSGQVYTQAIGEKAVHQMLKAVIMAHKFLTEEGMAIIFVPEFVQVIINGRNSNAMRLTITPEDKPIATAVSKQVTRDGF